MNTRIFALTFVLILVSLACSLLPGFPQEAESLPISPPTQNVAVLPMLTETADPPPAPPTSSPQPEPSPVVTPEFGVILVTEEDVLNVRSGPGIENAIIDTLDPHATGILMTGNRQNVGNSLWVEVQTPVNITGWVNAHYLTELIESEAFCADPRVDALLNDFVRAMNARDGAALAELISPTHGLTIRFNWWNPEVNFKRPNQVSALFDDLQVYDWGIQDGSGRPIQGTFNNEVLPWLDDVLATNFSRHCNDLESGSGGSAGYVLWPFEIHNLNYVALFRAAQPGDELNWRTWAVGIQYHQGQPYISYLVQYHWEI